LGSQDKGISKEGIEAASVGAKRGAKRGASRSLRRRGHSEQLREITGRPSRLKRERGGEDRREEEAHVFVPGKEEAHSAEEREGVPF